MEQGASSDSGLRGLAGAAQSRRTRSGCSPACRPRPAIEYRMDLAEEWIRRFVLLSLDVRRVIVTWRSIKEGGDFSGSAEEYARLVGEAYASGGTVDVDAGGRSRTGRDSRTASA